jgi:hypothetical protein
MTRNKMRAYMKATIESVVAAYCSESSGMRDMVRNANGFVGDGFVGVPMADKESTQILESWFGRRRWQFVEEEENSQ